jgi:hypothetical protein
MSKIQLAAHVRTLEAIAQLRMANQGKCLLRYLLRISQGEAIDKPTFEKLLTHHNSVAIFGEDVRGNILTGYQWYLSKKFKKQGLVEIIRDEPAEPSRTQELKSELAKKDDLIRQLQEALAEKNGFTEAFEEETEESTEE